METTGQETQDMKILAARVPVKHHRLVKKLAAERGVSISDLLQRHGVEALVEIAEATFGTEAA